MGALPGPGLILFDFSCFSVSFVVSFITFIYRSFSQFWRFSQDQGKILRNHTLLESLSLFFDFKTKELLQLD